MELLNIIKKAAIDAVKQSQPCDVLFGRVINTGPLQIQVNQKLILSHEFLVISQIARNVGVGEEVILLKAQGGQKYVVFK